MELDQLTCIYNKTLSKTDISERLAFPVRLIELIWGPNDSREKGFRVIDRFGGSWELRAHMRWDSRGHPKPEVYGTEWKSFVAMKELKVGDQLFFYRHPDPTSSHLVFVVSVKRTIKLMGEFVSAHLAA